MSMELKIKSVIGFNGKTPGASIYLMNHISLLLFTSFSIQAK